MWLSFKIIHQTFSFILSDYYMLVSDFQLPVYEKYLILYSTALLDSLEQNLVLHPENNEILHEQKQL